MKKHLSRRQFVTNSLCTTLAAAAVGTAGPLVAAPAPAAIPTAPADPAAMPKGKIGNLELSRLILGTNIITNYMHSRDLVYVKQLSARYHTDEKILETFAEAERHGVNAFMTHHEEKVVRLFTEFRRRGGKMVWIVAPTPQETKSVDSFDEIARKLKGYGADALYIHGAAADPLVQGGKTDLIRECVEICKGLGLPAGVAAHDLETIKACVAAKMPCDYYVKTFHSHNYATAPKSENIVRATAETPLAYWCSNPKETEEFMKTVPQPWIAYKVMAAGAIKPRDGFRFAYGGGADFILAGMFDFQIAEDAKIAQECVTRSTSRSRPWRG